MSKADENRIGRLVWLLVSYADSNRDIETSMHNQDEQLNVPQLARSTVLHAPSIPQQGSVAGFACVCRMDTWSAFWFSRWAVSHQEEKLAEPRLT